MALFGGARDISMFRGISRELMWDIIVQECALYKFTLLEETNVNIYMVKQLKKNIMKLQCYLMYLN